MCAAVRIVRLGEDVVSIAPSDAPPEKLEIDPRIIKRRTAVIRDRGRRRLRLVVAVAAVGVVIAGAFALLHSSLFSARHVAVRGAAHTSLQSVLAVTGLGAHPPLIDINLASADRLVKGLPWVDPAVVTRHWPDSVTVTITERSPVATVARGTEVALVDDTGRVLAWDASASGLPELGASGPAPEPGVALAARYGPGLTALRSVPPLLRSDLLSVKVASGGTVMLGLVGNVTVVLGPATDLAAKYEALASVLAGAPAAGTEVIDVTVPSAPLVAVPAKKAPPAPSKPPAKAPAGASTAPSATATTTPAAP